MYASGKKVDFSALPGTETRIAVSSDGGKTFGPSVVVGRKVCECCRTALAVNETELFVAWRHYFGESIRDIAIARSTDGGKTFSEPARVHADDWEISGCPHAGPALALGEAGKLYVAWYSGSKTHRGIFFATSGDGGKTFSRPVRLLSEPSLPVSQVKLAADRKGNVWAFYEDKRMEKNKIRMSKISGGAPATLSEEEAPTGHSPATAFNGNKLVNAWGYKSSPWLRVATVK
jgi:hypothetical protein